MIGVHLWENKLLVKVLFSKMEFQTKTFSPLTKKNYKWDLEIVALWDRVECDCLIIIEYLMKINFYSHIFIPILFHFCYFSFNYFSLCSYFSMIIYFKSWDSSYFLLSFSSISSNFNLNFSFFASISSSTFFFFSLKMFSTLSFYFCIFSSKF